MNAHTAPSEQDHFNAARKYQSYYDEALRDIGGRVPEPILGQTVNDYRRESLRTFKRVFLSQNDELYKVNYRGLRADTLSVFEPQLLQACVANADNTNGMKPGEFRQITKRNPYGQVSEIRFVGPESFVKAMGRPGRLAKIRTPDTHPGWFPKEVPSVFVSGSSLRVA